MRKTSDLWVLFHPTLRKLIMELKIVILIGLFSVANVFGTNAYANSTTVMPDMENAAVETEIPEIDLTSINDLQQIRVSGTITDAATGDAMPGVNVLVKGTTLGAITDMNGKYSIAVPDRDAVLVFSFIGYSILKVPVAGKSIVDATLVSETQALEEVVVIGYGSQRKVNLTGAVSSINFDNAAIASRPITNVSTSLTGLSSGMFVIQGSGEPSDDGATIKIRGTGSLNASQNPLIIIDGQPGDMNTLNPNDIATVSILKDAASSSIYGSRASNGVILITTKSGQDSGGKISLSYTGNVGLAGPTKLFDMISNTADHMSLINQIQTNSGLSPLYTTEWINEWREKSKTDPILYPNTNWWDAVVKPNTIQHHNLMASGGNEKVRFYASLGAMNNNGVIDNTGYTRFTFRNNLTYKVNNWLKLGNNLTALFGKADPGNVESIFTYMTATTPGLLPKHPDGRYGGAMTGGGEQQSNNIVRMYETNLGENLTQNYTAKVFAILSPIKGLEINGSYFIDMYNNDGWSSGRPANTWDFQHEAIMQASEVGARLSVSNFFVKSRRNVIDLFGTYKFAVGSHNFVALLGYNQEYFKRNNFSASKLDLYSLDIPVLDAAPSNPQAGGSAYDFAMRSYFGRLNYDLQGKYLFEVNFRYDGSSRFSPENRWGFFPSLSAGWRISEEAFWSPLREVVNYMKLRASWGQLGNNGIGNYEWQSVYNAANHSFNGSIVQGLAPSAIANNDITWETTNVVNIGTDFNLFKKIVVTLDYYNKFTHGILANVPIPYVNGGLTAPRVNSAEVRNTGIETDISYNVKIGDFSLSVSGNGSFNKNKIINYKGDYLEPHGNGAWTEGLPIGIFWVREIDHIVQEQSEIDALVGEGWTFNPSNPGPGDFLYKDQNDDKIIDDNDRILKGNPIPKFTFGATFNLEYKGFDLYGLLNGVSGWDKYLGAQFFSLQQRVDGYLYSTDFMNAWTPENKSTTIPKIYVNNSKNNQQSDYFLHSCNYLRLKSLQLGYNVPSRLIQNIGIDKIRIYMNLENYFTFTSFPGMDPENDSNVTYPLMKTLSFGLNISL